MYPQFFDASRLPGGAEPSETAINNATRKVVEELESIEKKYFAQGSPPFLCGNTLSVADTYVATIVVQLEWVESVDMKLWSKLNLWLKEVYKQEHWDEVHVKHKEFVESLKNVPLESTWGTGMRGKRNAVESEHWCIDIGIFERDGEVNVEMRLIGDE